MSHLKRHEVTEGLDVGMFQNQLCVLEREPWQQGTSLYKVQLPSTPNGVMSVSR